MSHHTLLSSHFRLDSLLYAMIVIYESDHAQVVLVPTGVNSLTHGLRLCLSLAERDVLAPCTIDSGAVYVVMDILSISAAVRHDLKGCDAVFQNPYLQLSAIVATQVLFLDINDNLVFTQGRRKPHLDFRDISQILSYACHPVGIVGGWSTVDETYGLILQVPVVIVLVAQIGGKTYDGGCAFESKGTSMNSHRYETVTAAFLQLFNNFRPVGQLGQR